MKRRAFLDWLIRLCGTGLGGLVLYPVVKYLVPPEIPEAATNRVIVAKVDEIAPGHFKTFPFGAEPALLVRTPDGEYRAFSAVCTHLGCTVQYQRSDSRVWCACHDGFYDVDGRNIAGPPPTPLERYRVHVAGDEIVVERGART
jgi:Rieske Fe-S protein